MKVFLKDHDTCITHDPQQRPVRFFHFACPCGKDVWLFCTREPCFSLPPKFPPPASQHPTNVWHYELSADGRTVSISPSVGLHGLPDHKPECHLVITGAEVELEGSPPWNPGPNR